MLRIKELEFDINNDLRSDRELTFAEFTSRICGFYQNCKEIRRLSNNRIQVTTDLSIYIYYPQFYR